MNVIGIELLFTALVDGCGWYMVKYIISEYLLTTHYTYDTKTYWYYTVCT